MRSPGSLRTLLLAASVAGLGAGSVMVSADDGDAATREYAHRLAVGVCGTCHGTHGSNTQPKFPQLAGQNANYLATQLKNFRGQTRGDPDALGYMWGMAAQLDDATIDALAKYYSGQKAEPSRAILKQLASFQSNMRNMAVMHGVAQNLRRPEMQAVAAFLEVQK
jgi:cytochrome c553